MEAGKGLKWGSLLRFQFLPYCEESVREVLMTDMMVEVGAFDKSGARLPR